MPFPGYSQLVPGVSQLAVGAGSLWAINPAGRVSRFDAETGEPQTTVLIKATSFGGIAHGEGGVWVVGGTGRDADRPGDQPAGRDDPAACHGPRRDRHGSRLGVGERA